MLAGVHWIDLLPAAAILAFFVGLAVLIARNIGAGYAKARHRLEHQPEQPSNTP